MRTARASARHRAVALWTTMGMSKKNFSMRMEVATSPRKKRPIIGRMAAGRG